MPTNRYIAAKRKKRSEAGKYGNTVKRQLMIERGNDLKVVGKCITSGVLGNHTIELLAGDQPMIAWIRVDGHIRRPRTANGFRRILANVLFKKAVNL